MKTLIAATVALAALAGTALAADGARGRGPGITLYEGPNYQGPSRNFAGDVENMAQQGFNDRAQSARVVGRWRICEDARLRGRCAEVSGDIPNLAALRMSVAISSIQYVGQIGAGPRPGGGYGPGPGGPGGPGGGPGGGAFAGQSLDGRTASFFPRPQPGPYRNAEDFCRRLGFAGVIYANDRGQALSDVVCRR